LNCDTSTGIDEEEMMQVRKIIGAAVVGVPVLALAQSVPSTEAEYVAAARVGKLSITADFKDPTSAQWRGLFVSEKAYGYYVLCGEVNGKNSYGAYVGFQPFYAAVLVGNAAMKQIASGGKESAVYESMAPSMCGHRVFDVPE
jgi:hypothetical protein